MSAEFLAPRLDNPFAAAEAKTPPREGSYEETIEEAIALRRRPFEPGASSLIRQHQKGRMTVWERIEVLTQKRPKILFQNWGKNLDGASLVTAVIEIEGRDVALYGHDFTVRAGSIDATNGRKLARLYQLAAERGLPLVGMNDSAGAFVPAGVGGLDGYAEAFTALRKISGVVPSIMCMFGFNAGGGSYLPRQGSFVIQPQRHVLRAHRAGVVKSVLGEDVTPDELGGPGVHGPIRGHRLRRVPRTRSQALRTVQRLLDYLPDNSTPRRSLPQATSDPLDRPTGEIDTYCARPSTRPPASTLPSTSRIIIQQICDHGDYFEIQPERARNTITAFGRLGGHVVGFVANNSAVRIGPDRRGRGVQERPLHPLLQPLQHSHHLHGGHHRLPPRARSRSAAVSCKPGGRCSMRSSTCARRASSCSFATPSVAPMPPSTTTPPAPTWCWRCRRRGSRSWARPARSSSTRRSFAPPCGLSCPSAWRPIVHRDCCVAAGYDEAEAAQGRGRTARPPPGLQGTRKRAFSCPLRAAS